MTITADNYTNFAFTTLAGGAGGIGSVLLPADTSLTVKAGDGALFPSTTPFNLLLGTEFGAHEIVVCSAISGDVLTVSRGQEGTNAVTWQLYTSVQLVATAGSLNDLWNAIATLDGTVANFDKGTISVLDYGAKVDGSTDDATAVNNALAAATPGQTVCIPTGTGSCRISAPLIVPPGVTLEGQMGRRVAQRSTEVTIQPTIKPLASFTGAAAITLLDKEQGGYSADNNGIRLRHLSLDGSAISSGSVDGIKATGLVHDVMLENISIYDFSHNGVTTTSYTRLDSSTPHPYSWTINNCIADSCGNNGWSLNGLTDAELVEVEALGSGVHGFFLSTMANSHLTNCRAEWSGTGHGFYISGGWGTTPAGSGGAVFVGCSTDRNNSNGVYIDATGSGSLVFNGITCRRDGRNGASGGGSFAGLAASSSTMPIIVNGLAVYPGQDDNGTGTISPDYGASFTGNTWVSVASGYLHAIVAGWHDGGTNTVLRRGPNIGEATGNPTGPTRTASTPWNTTGTETVSLATADQAALSIANSQANTGLSLIDVTGSANTSRMLDGLVSGDTNRRFDLRVDGQMAWGSGSASRDTNLYRSAANTLKTDNSLAVATNLSVVGTSSLDNAAIVSDGAGSLDISKHFGTPQPREHNLVAWTFDPIAVRTSTANALVSGDVYLVGLWANRSANVTKIYWGIGTVANTPTASQCWVGLFNSAGTLLQSTDVSGGGVTTATGLKTTTITSQAVTPGLYWIGFVFNASTGPKLWTGGEIDSNLLNVGLTASTARYATNGTGTALATITPSSNTISSTLQAAIWAAIG